MVYKIRRKSDGLFSPGGTDAIERPYSWKKGDKGGKVWQGIGPLKSHLNLLIEYGNSIPEDWEVVTYEMIPTKTEEAWHLVNLVKILKK